MTKSITSRDPQGRHATSIFEAAYNQCRLDKGAAQQLNERGGELRAGIAKLLAELSISDQYANEEVGSNYAYPKEYKGPKRIEYQIRALAKILDLDPSQALEFAKNLPALPDGAEGWFAIPSVDALAKKHFPEVTDPAQKYCQAVQLVHAKVAASRPFHNYYEGQITPAQLQVHARTAHALTYLAETQKGDLPTGQTDILIVAAQLGMRHRGKSVRRARKVFMANEFGLGSLAVGSIVLTHPERLVRSCEELNMNCSGDEFSPEDDGDFSASLGFGCYTDKVRFASNFVEIAGVFSGQVSGFLPGSQTL